MHTIIDFHMSTTISKDYISQNTMFATCLILFDFSHILRVGLKRSLLVLHPRLIEYMD